MNDGAALAGFAGVMALGQFSPGPDMVLLTRVALARGGRAGTWTATGIACGLTLHAAVAMSGAALLLMGNGMLACGLRFAAGLYLVWLGIGLLRAAWCPAGAAVGDGGEGGGPGAGACWRRGFLCNLFNPKAALFFAAIAAPYLAGVHTPWWPFALGAVIAVQGFVLWIAWAWALQWRPLRAGYRKCARWIDGAFGIALIALAALVLG